MKRIWIVGAVIVVVAATLLGYGIWHHEMRPASSVGRFELRVRLRAAMSASECRAEVESVRYSPLLAAQWCKGAGAAASYVATVTNTSGHAAWIDTCRVDPMSRSGHVVGSFAGTSVPMWVRSPGVGARPYLAPGASATLDWFVAGLAPSDVTRYTGSCSYIVYRNPEDIPI